MDRRRILNHSIVGAALLSVLSFIILKCGSGIILRYAAPGSFPGFLLALKVSRIMGANLENHFYSYRFFFCFTWSVISFPCAIFIFSSGKYYHFISHSNSPDLCYAMVWLPVHYTLKVIDLSESCVWFVYSLVCWYRFAFILWYALPAMSAIRPMLHTNITFTDKRFLTWLLS